MIPSVIPTLLSPAAAPPPLSPTPMAETLLLFATTFFFAFLFTSTCSSRSSPFPHLETSTLDVAASIQHALDSITSAQQTLQLHDHHHHHQLTGQRPSGSNSTLTLQLFPRSESSRGGNYSALILSKLERDSARVRSLQSRLDLAVNGIRVSDLQPLNKDNIQAQALEGPVVSGSNQGSGEYFTRIGIGQPPTQLYVVLDTGSDVSWLQCEPCADCYEQSDPIFRPASSSSYSPLTCDTPQCRSLDVSQCRGRMCLYEVSYGDGSYTVGDFVTEKLTFGGSSVGGIALGCGHTNEGLFAGAAGLLGLGGGRLSFPTQINSSSFSYCLVDRDSSAGSTLEFDSPLPPDAILTPLLRNRQLDTFYYMGVSGISVGDQMLSIPASAFQMDESGNGGVIIDSGTAVSRLQTGVYNALRDAFMSGTQHLPPANGVALFDTCYNLASMRSVEVPTVALHFPGGGRLRLPAKNYVIPVDSSGTFCLAFAPTTSSLSIVGNVQQQGTRVSFDLAKKLVGFSPDKC